MQLHQLWGPMEWLHRLVQNVCCGDMCRSTQVHLLDEMVELAKRSYEARQGVLERSLARVRKAVGADLLRDHHEKTMLHMSRRVRDPGSLHAGQSLAESRHDQEAGHHEDEWEGIWPRVLGR